MTTSPPQPPIALLTILAALTILLMPMAGLRLPLASGPGGFDDVQLVLYAFDLPLALAAIVVAPAALRRLRGLPFDPIALTGAALLALFAVALAVHPTPGGAALVVRLTACALLAYAVSLQRSARARALVLGALAVAIVSEVLVAAVQLANDAPAGLGVLGEFADPIGRTPRGFMWHPYALAGLALVSSATFAWRALGSARPRGWTILAAVAIAPAGVSYSRVALLAAALVGAPLAVARRRAVARWVIAAIALGIALPAAAGSEGWTTSLDRGLLSDRGALALQSLAIVSTSPVVGVGPDRYLPELSARPDLRTTRLVQEVHSVPLIVAAEAGVPAGLALIALLVLIARRALALGPGALSLAGALLPWILLDVYPYVNPQGAILTAVWGGLLIGALPGPAERSAA